VPVAARTARGGVPNRERRPRLLSRLFLACACTSFAGTAAGDALDRLLDSHWERPLPPRGDVPAHWEDVDDRRFAATCGSCHVREHEDWSASRHAAAMGPGVFGQLLGTAPRARALAFEVRVEPDAFYTGFFAALLARTGEGGARALLRDARREAAASGFLTHAGRQANGGPVPVPGVVEVPPGPFVSGSDDAERERAYALDEAAYGHSVTREQRWYEAERERAQRSTGAFAIARTPITNRQYAAFVAHTGHRAPGVGEETWASYGLVHPWSRTRRFAWSEGRPPAGREDHPVVLVSHADAEAYARWLSERTGRRWRLPTELEWEKAARGTDGSLFPWGNYWRPGRLNSHDAGPFDTTPVGRYPRGASPFGTLDAAGQVYEWTATPAGTGRALVKGGSWDDKGCGVCRPAARHSRPLALKHILIGFRLVRE